MKQSNYDRHHHARDAFEDRILENRRIVIRRITIRGMSLVIAVQDNAGGIDDTYRRRFLTHTSHHIRLRYRL